jgi:hypothetical protein
VPANKDHHFVPQFYLRQFSRDGRSIGLFSVKTDRLVLKASIRGQCQHAYFYGKDGKTEAAFAMMEGATAQVLRNIVQAQRPPTPWRENHVTLMFHVVSQHARTMYAADEQNEYSDIFAKSLIRPTLPRDGITAEDLDRVRVVLTNPIGEALRLIVPTFPLTMDLRCVVLVNQTKVGFITSDNPVVLYNQLLEERTYASNTGLQSVGLQIYLPLTPTMACFFYDPHVYGVGPKNPTRLLLEGQADIDQLNALQLLNAVDNVYFHAGYNEHSQLSKLYSSIRRYRRKKMTNFISQRESPIKPDETRELIGFFREDIRCAFRPSFLKVLKRAARAKPELLRRIVVRDPKLCGAYERFRSEVRAGKYSEGDFMRFLHEES